MPSNTFMHKTISVSVQGQWLQIYSQLLTTNMEIKWIAIEKPTSPKTTCFPSSHGVAAVHKKNLWSKNKVLLCIYLNYWDIVNVCLQVIQQMSIEKSLHSLHWALQKDTVELTGFHLYLALHWPCSRCLVPCEQLHHRVHWSISLHQWWNQLA